MRRVSRKGVRFVASWEGFSPRAVDIGDGVLTIGYGTTSAVKPIRPGDTITERKARRWLRQELRRLVPEIPRRFRMKQQEIDALASFAYNLGPGAVSNPQLSTLSRRLRSDEGRTFHSRCRIYREELPRWINAGTKFEEGLRRRREAEVALAVHGDYHHNR